MPADTPDRRGVAVDRRRGERRGEGSGRRVRERRTATNDRALGLGGLILCATAVAIALWASIHAPVVSTPSPACRDGIGGQYIRHRQLSLLWLPAVALATTGLVLPSSRRRPVTTLVLCGMFVGLAIAAVLRLDSWVDGLCFV